MDRKQHWEQVYSTKPSDTVSWFQQHAGQSLNIIRGTGAGKGAEIIDIGGGASILVDELLAEGYGKVSVLDISAAALAVAKQRLGNAATAVNWIVGDITSVALPPHQYDIWHDRAVFHFLTEPADRQAYVQQVLHSVRPGGHVIVATFAEDGPEKCSGLTTVRYRPESLHAEFGDSFRLVAHEKEAHKTPAGKEQQFVYCYCRLVNG